MTEQSLLDELAKLKTDMALADVQIQLVTTRLWELLQARHVNDFDALFQAWVDHARKVDHNWIVHIQDSNGEELISYDGPVYAERHQSIDLDQVLDVLNQEDDFTGNQIREWKQALMDANFGSCVWDW